MKAIIKIVITTAIFFIALAAAYFMGRLGRGLTVVIVPNQGQMQEILNAVEPNAPLKVDYVIGERSRGKWDRVVNNSYAAAYFKKDRETEGRRDKVKKRNTEY